ncbi:MAG: sigma-54-dependent Fis family transcriptional regulator [Deltaproteobacteria bacterium]|nr:sigma-54-dependent Fis family transcriptional regulator [Deltaproteobacteria bacterium]
MVAEGAVTDEARDGESVREAGDGEPLLLVVDDEAGNLESLRRIFEREPFRVATAPGPKEALDEVRREAPAVVLTDVRMPGGDGVSLLRAVKQLAPGTEVVLMTAYGTVETAVESMKEGAYDFVEKPLKRAVIVRAVRRAAERAMLLRENARLRATLEGVQEDGRTLVGTSPAWRRTVQMGMQVATSQASVLLLGESGTGKEVLARAIHRHSNRADKPFIAVSCAAIPETILESELFGYERGAFTGAAARRDGRFAVAHGGTLFLDEVGEIPPSVQVKLLRVLQSGEYEPLGSGGKARQADVRLVAATNRDLAAEVAAGRFRDDLYYRLNVIAITCPPLRHRHGDVALLAQHFLRKYCLRDGRAVLGFTPAALEALERHAWPGNVRELENAVERAVVLARGELIDVGDLPPSVPAERTDGAEIMVAIGTPLEEVERRLIEETLRRTKGDKKLAAQLLGIAARTIYRKLDLYGAGKLGETDSPGNGEAEGGG